MLECLVILAILTGAMALALDIVLLRREQQILAELKKPLQYPVSTVWTNTNN
jgi:hypothetical protein